MLGFQVGVVNIVRYSNLTYYAGFSLRIVVAGESCKVTGELL